MAFGRKSARKVAVRLCAVMACLAVPAAGGCDDDHTGAASGTGPPGAAGTRAGSAAAHPLRTRGAHAAPGGRRRTQEMLPDGMEKKALTWGISKDEDYRLISSWPVTGPVRRVGGQTRDGKYMLRFEVVPRPKVFRSEIARPSVPMGSNYWYGFSINVPKEWKRDPGGSILAQWHAQVGRDVDNYPVAALYVIGDSWQIRMNWNSRGDTSKGPGWHRKTYRLGPVRKGTWTDWVLHAKWSFEKDGLVEVWRDGQKVVRHRGPNEYVNEIGPYFKMGIYHPVWRHDGSKIPPGQRPLVSYADAVRLARNGSYAAVRPR